MKNKIMLIYPPGKLYQRGEDRCQGSIDDSSATAMRACNDLGYGASVLLKKNYEIFLKDYQTERLSLEVLLADIKEFNPDMIMLSVTNATIFLDIDVVEAIKAISSAIIVLKGAIFFDANFDVLELLNLNNVEFLIGGEVEFSIDKIADYALKDIGLLSSIPNIFYKNENGNFAKTEFNIWDTNLDSIPFPARHLINNDLYVRPDTGEAMASIWTSRGCSAACIYCLSPQISGKNMRYRSPSNVMAELNECFYKYNIKNFFFKSDTFTMDQDWVKELCELIINSPLYKKIAFTANSRTNPITQETLHLMKKAGCFMVAFGFESGSSNTMKKIKKGATIEQNIKAAKMAKAAKLPFYGFYMIGFPWEDKEDLDKTYKHIFDTAPDFLEVHIALPYFGTELYNYCKEYNTLTDGILGSNYFDAGITGTKTLTLQELKDFRDYTTKKFYLRPSYICKRLLDVIKNPKALPGYFTYGIRLLKNLFKAA